MSNGALPLNVVKENQMPRRSWLSKKKINKKKRELLREYVTQIHSCLIRGLSGDDGAWRVCVCASSPLSLTDDRCAYVSMCAASYQPLGFATIVDQVFLNEIVCDRAPRWIVCPHCLVSPRSVHAFVFRPAADAAYHRAEANERLYGAVLGPRRALLLWLHQRLYVARPHVQRD